MKEQAERKRFAIALPKAERTCLNALEQWEINHINEQFLINDIPMRQILEQQQQPTTSNVTTTTIPKTVDQNENFKLILSVRFVQVSMPTISSSAAPQRKNNIRKKSLRTHVKQPSESQITKTHHEEADEDTLEFTQLENIKHINGLPRVRHTHKFSDFNPFSLY